jgi:hypothetical protein
MPVCVRDEIGYGIGFSVREILYRILSRLVSKLDCVAHKVAEDLAQAQLSMYGKRQHWICQSPVSASGSSG